MRGSGGQRSRRKGATGERELCALLQAEFGLPVRRRLGQARDSGYDADLPPFAVEVKRRRRVSLLYEAIAQADGASGIPVLFLRADGREWLVAMRFADWARLAREEIAAAITTTAGNGEGDE